MRGYKPRPLVWDACALPSNCFVMAAEDEEKNSGALIELCSKDAGIDDVAKLLSSTKLSVDETDKDGMTPLMYAAYRGNLDVCRKLLQHKADVNWNGHKDGYTALMFATIAGHKRVVELLLENGARTDVVNGVNKTAVQLGSFVGQHECVRIINNHFSLSQLDHYTATQGLEKAPKLDPANAVPLHSLISMHTIHPVKVTLTLQSSCAQLLTAHSSVCRVLQLLREKMEKEQKEPQALKMHCLSFVVERCAKSGINQILKLLLSCREDGVAESLDRFLRQCLQEYPNLCSQLLRQMVATLAKTPPGGPPSAVSLFQQMVFGKRSDSEEALECCSVCGDLITSVKKCSRCKQVFYCGRECQTLAWTVGNHQKLCKIWTAKSEAEKDAAAKQIKPSED